MNDAFFVCPQTQSKIYPRRFPNNRHGKSIAANFCSRNSNPFVTPKRGARVRLFPRREWKSINRQESVCVVVVVGGKTKIQLTSRQ